VRKLKVAWVTPGPFAVPSDRSSSVERVVEHLARLLAATADITVYGRRAKGFPAEEYLQGVRYRRVPYRGPVSYFREVARQIAGQKPDVIRVENRPKLALWLKRRFSTTPVWLALHSLTFVTPPRIGCKRLRECFRAVDLILANSEFLRARLIELIPEAAHKIETHVPGVEPAAFPSRWEADQTDERERMLAASGLGGRKVVLFAGRLRRYKGVHRLLAAMPHIVRAVPEAVLVIAGGASYGSNKATPYVRRLHRMARSMPGHVRFLTYVPHRRLAEWYRCADVAVVPSSRNEAFGLVVVEAMASGVPVVATAAGGIPEIVADGVTGYLVPLGTDVSRQLAEKTSELLLRPLQARMMGEAGRSRVLERFTWEHAANRMLETMRRRLPRTSAVSDCV